MSAMTAPERRILNTAVTALGRTTGITVRIRPAAARKDDAAGALVEIGTDGRKHCFSAEVKQVDRFATPAMLKVRSKASPEPPLLVAPYITREVAERCRQLRLPFIDTAGNAYLGGPGLFVYVVGLARPVELRRAGYRALNAAGLKLTFALLCRPALLNENYRNIAMDAGVALGTVSSDMRDLETRGFLNLKTPRARRKLVDPKRMFEEWVTHYPVTLRPNLNLGRFEADPEQLRRADLIRQHAFWGGEPAAEKLTGYLKPARFTIYAREPIAKLIAAGRMRAAQNGAVEILEKFWRFEPDGAEKQFPDVVPPILAYADLLTTNESRNAEAAQIIYEQKIEPAFRSRK